ncbi:MAG: AAA family ATPase [Betaproteobacteria bacterium]|nr:AAA family ATPase [Rhodocyclales bacterium]
MPEALHHAAGDQAAGLRRLFGARASQVVAFVSARGACGRTTLVAQTAAALAHAGHRVVIIDENRGPDNVLGTLGMDLRHDLMDMVEGSRPLHKIMQAAAPLLRVVAASRFADELLHLDAVAAGVLNAALREIQQDASFVLIDCAARRGGHVSPLVTAARHIAVVLAAQGSAITHAYSLIKRLASERGRDGFQVVITRARSEDEALAIFDNLRRTAREHLGVRLDYLGSSRVPLTDHLADALQSRLPIASADAGGGGFFSFDAPSAPRRSAPAFASKRLESVV